MNEMIGFVYETENLINGKKYIGKCLYNRINSWEKYLGSGIYLKEDIKKYGKENFKKVILVEATTEDELKKLEESYILSRNAVESDQYYNIKYSAVGGDTFTTNPKKEEIRKKRVVQMSGKNNHQYNKQKTKKMIESVKLANSKVILIDGVTYPSLTFASKKLNIGVTTISYRLNSKSFDSYSYI